MPAACWARHCTDSSNSRVKADAVSFAGDALPVYTGQQIDVIVTSLPHGELTNEKLPRLSQLLGTLATQSN